MRDRTTVAAMIVPAETCWPTTSAAPVKTVAIWMPSRSARAAAASALAVERPRSMLSSERRCARRQRPAMAGSMPMPAITSVARKAAAVSAWTSPEASVACDTGRRASTSVASAAPVRMTAPASPTSP